MANHFAWNNQDRQDDKVAIAKALKFANRHGIVLDANREGCEINDISAELDYQEHSSGDKRLSRLFWAMMTRHYGTKCNGVSRIDGGVVGLWSK